MKLELYYAPHACSLVPYVSLVEAGANFEVHAVNMRKGEHLSPEYLRINPKHKIPVLVIDGVPLTENVAIEIWIARNFPSAKLLPADPTHEARAISLMAWCASGIHPALSVMARPYRYCTLPDSEANVRECAGKLLLDSLQVADEMLDGRQWFFDHFTAPDVYFYWCFRRAGQLAADVSGFSHCQRHFEQVQKRPSLQQLLGYEQQVIDLFAKAG